MMQINSITGPLPQSLPTSRFRVKDPWVDSSTSMNQQPARSSPRYPHPRLPSAFKSDIDSSLHTTNTIFLSQQPSCCQIFTEMCFQHRNTYTCSHEARIEDTRCDDYDKQWDRCFGNGMFELLETRLPYGCRICRREEQRKARDEWRKGKKYYAYFPLGKEQ